MNQYYIINILIPCIIYMTILILNNYNISIFKNKIIVALSCGILILLMPLSIGVPMYLILLICLLIRAFSENDDLKKYISDDTIKGYHLVFSLINNNNISIIITTEEFNKIEKWYISKTNKENYLLSKNGEYISLNKVNIVGFTYEPITNKKNILKIIAYVFRIPVPRVFNLLSYIKCICIFFITCLAFTIYNKYSLNININDVISNTAMLNQTLNQAIKVATLLFVLYYICYIVFQAIKLLNKNQYYFYETVNKYEHKVYNYAIVNFLGIIILGLGLLPINIF